MTFDQIRTDVMDRLNLSSPEASTRIGRAINRKYRLVTSAIGLDLSRRSTVQEAVTQGVSTLTFPNAEKIINVFNRNVSPYKMLTEVTVDELENTQPFTLTDSPTKWAQHSQTSDSVTILLNCIPQTAFTLYADVRASVADLSGSNEPNFPESYHDVLIEGVIADEYRKLEKPQLAQMAQSEYQRILSDLKLWMAVSGKDFYQSQTANSRRAASGAGSSSGSTFDGAQSWTQTGLITFDRDPSAPFAVTSGSAKVSNLDADLLDGKDWNTAGALPDAGLGLTDVTTNDVTSTKHGFAPKSPADATKFLNGAATPAYALVKDSDLSTSDVVTNNVSSTKHGFAPKNPNDATKFLDGTGAYDNINASTDVTAGTLATARGGTSVDIASAALPLGSGQITFPAAQNSSAGVNTLDDYEEGTWTPAISSTGGGAGNYSTQNGWYVKVGRLVTFGGRISFNSSKGTLAAGNLSITGLPFTVENVSYSGGFWINYWAGMTTNTLTLNGFTDANTTNIQLRALLTAAAANLTNLTLADVSTAWDIIFFGAYRATA